jgi:hypothetical protein
MSESLRQALVEFLNLQGHAVYPTARITILEEGCLDFQNSKDDGVQHVCLDMHDLYQFLLEYSIV